MGEEWFDLKNFYYFSGLDLDATTGTVRLIFEGHPESGRPELIGKKVAVCFREISHFEISQLFVPRVNSELLRIGFKSPSDDDTDWLLSDEQSVEVDHLLFCLGNDEFVRICANRADLEKLS